MSKHLIAVVDDDDSFRVALVESLASIGYSADSYTSAEEYLDSAGDIEYCCIVTDIHMHGVSGFDLIKRLGDRGSLTPVVLITALWDPELETNAAAAGALCFLIKPFAESELIHCIELAVATIEKR